MKEDKKDKATPLSFKTIIPCPPDEDNDWCIEHWGTKWDACEVNCKDEDELTYWFETAWSPPCPVIKKASKLFPGLHFKLVYAEGGIGFWGEEEYEKGKCTASADYEQEEYMELYDEAFKEERDGIDSLSYEDLKQRLIMGGCFDNTLNELHALEKINDEDLPLLVGRNWENQECIDLIEERIKR